MIRIARGALAIVAAAAIVAACDRKAGTLTSRGSVAGGASGVVIDEIMANPRAAPDDHGEWIELHNIQSTPVELRGWTVASGTDRGITSWVLRGPDRTTVVTGTAGRAELSQLAGSLQLP